MPKRGRTHVKIFSLIYSKLFLLFGSVLLIFILLALGRGFLHRSKVSGEINELKSEIQRLDNSNSELSQLLDYLSSEEFIKQEGKIKFGLRESGEQLVVVNDHQTKKRSLEITQENDVEITNPQKWWNYFFN